MAADIILVNPAIYDFAAYDLFAKPLGLLCLAAQLRRVGFSVALVDALDRRAGWQAVGVDNPPCHGNGTGKYFAEEVEKPDCLAQVPRNYRRYGLSAEKFAEKMATQSETQPLAIMVTSIMTYWYPGVVEAIELAREVWPGVPVALGGVYASLMPGHAVSVCRPDKVFVGSDFAAVLQWLRQLRQNQHNSQRQNEEDFETNEFLLPSYDLYEKLDYLTVLASLGCPFGCDYCASKILQKRFRQCPVDSFMEHLAGNLGRVAKHDGYYNVAFTDDALLVRAEEQIMPIMRRIGSLGLPIRLHSPNGIHARYITEPIAELMRANNFRMVRLSYEGADSSSLAQRSSDHKIDDAVFAEAVRYLKQAGYKPAELEAYILTGLPGQSMTEAERSAAAVHEQGVKARICQYTPIPGTKMFEQACREYGIDPKEPLLHNNSALPIVAEVYGHEAFQKFKDRVNQLNNAL
ncbi:MAG: radical SAM protein [Sedimentisphaerales bacterium]|nr:radical SAM protein [Sedimentisphaerales bacterium]